MADRATSNRRPRKRRSVERPELPFAEFCNAVRDLLDETAADKGYHQTGPTGANLLYEFVAETAGGPGHALGEIIYRCAGMRHASSPGTALPALW